MNHDELTIEERNALTFSDSTRAMMLVGVSENTLRALRHALLDLDSRISDAGSNFRLTERIDQTSEQ